MRVCVFFNIGVFFNIFFQRFGYFLFWFLKQPLRNFELKGQKQTLHCVKSVPIRSYSGPYFPAFRRNSKRYFLSLRSISPYSVRMRENTDENNSEYGHFSHSVSCIVAWGLTPSTISKNLRNYMKILAVIEINTSCFFAGILLSIVISTASVK